jgi:Homing endonuclease associated repeat
MGFEDVARTAPRDVDAFEAWREALVSEIRAWADAHGGEPPRVMDWNRVYARRHGVRFEEGWPTYSMVSLAFGSWNAGIRAAGFEARTRGRLPRPGRPDHCIDCGRDFKEWPRKGDRCRRCASFLYYHGVPRSPEALRANARRRQVKP